MELKVARQALETMLAQAALAGDAECCGLLLGQPGQIAQAQPARNVAPEPARQFEIDPQALFAAHRAERGGGPCLLGYYHSHPNGQLAPSRLDQERAAGDGRVWAIIAAGQVRFWQDAADGFQPLSYRLLPG